MILSFVVPGPPVGKERPRVTSRGTYTPTKTTRYENTIRDAVRFVIYRNPNSWPTDGEYKVEAKFYLPDWRTIDCDNLGKSCLDGLQYGAFENDAQVSQLTVLRVFGDPNPRTEVTVEYLGAKPVRPKAPSKRKAKAAV